MKIYAIHRVDGGVEIMYAKDGIDPAAEIRKWHPDRQAEVTGAFEELADVPGMSATPAEARAARAMRKNWRVVNGKIVP
jgi:hypothetical protein